MSRNKLFQFFAILATVTLAENHMDTTASNQGRNLSQITGQWIQIAKYQRDKIDSQLCDKLLIQSNLILHKNCHEPVKDLMYLRNDEGLITDQKGRIVDFQTMEINDQDILFLHFGDKNKPKDYQVVFTRDGDLESIKPHLPLKIDSLILSLCTKPVANECNGEIPSDFHMKQSNENHQIPKRFSRDIKSNETNVNYVQDLGDIDDSVTIRTINGSDFVIYDDIYIPLESPVDNKEIQGSNRSINGSKNKVDVYRDQQNEEKHSTDIKESNSNSLVFNSDKNTESVNNNQTLEINKNQSEPENFREAPQNTTKSVENSSDSLNEHNEEFNDDPNSIAAVTVKLNRTDYDYYDDFFGNNQDKKQKNNTLSINLDIPHYENNKTQNNKNFRERELNINQNNVTGNLGYKENSNTNITNPERNVITDRNEPENLSIPVPSNFSSDYNKSSSQIQHPSQNFPASNLDSDDNYANQITKLIDLVENNSNDDSVSITENGASNKFNDFAESSNFTFNDLNYTMEIYNQTIDYFYGNVTTEDYIITANITNTTSNVTHDADLDNTTVSDSIEFNSTTLLNTTSVHNTSSVLNGTTASNLNVNHTTVIIVTATDKPSVTNNWVNVHGNLTTQSYEGSTTQKSSTSVIQANFIMIISVWILYSFA